jgi:L-serine dehydratase
MKKIILSPLDLVTSAIVGPSSSHTAGVMRIGRKIREKSGELKKVKIILYNSLADTGDAHMTNSALVAGLLGWPDDDPRIPFSFGYAEEQGLKISWAHRRDDTMHPNTLIAEVADANGKEHCFKGVSVGGGRFTFVSVNKMNMNGNHNK